MSVCLKSSGLSDDHVVNMFSCRTKTLSGMAALWLTCVMSVQAGDRPQLHLLIHTSSLLLTENKMAVAVMTWGFEAVFCVTVCLYVGPVMIQTGATWYGYFTWYFRVNMNCAPRCTTWLWPALQSESCVSHVHALCCTELKSCAVRLWVERQWEPLSRKCCNRYGRVLGANTMLLSWRVLVCTCVYMCTCFCFLVCVCFLGRDQLLTAETSMAVGM